MSHRAFYYQNDSQLAVSIDKKQKKIDVYKTFGYGNKREKFRYMEYGKNVLFIGEEELFISRDNSVTFLPEINDEDNHDFSALLGDIEFCGSILQESPVFWDLADKVFDENGEFIAENLKELDKKISSFLKKVCICNMDDGSFYYWYYGSKLVEEKESFMDSYKDRELPEEDLVRVWLNHVDLFIKSEEVKSLAEEFYLMDISEDENETRNILSNHNNSCEEIEESFSEIFC